MYNSNELMDFKITSNIALFRKLRLNEANYLEIGIKFPSPYYKF